VKWVETRSEGMMVTHHGRDQIDKVKVGFKDDGTMTAFHCTIIADLGAYQMLLTPMIPPLSAFVMCGVYKTPAVKTDVIDVMTNKFPTARPSCTSGSARTRCASGRSAAAISRRASPRPT
jgi:carbon-monoxide dehydrogenase large subunit